MKIGKHDPYQGELEGRRNWYKVSYISLSLLTYKFIQAVAHLSTQSIENEHRVGLAINR